MANESRSGAAPSALESLADISAEIRARAGVWIAAELKQYDLQLADRIEAAWGRERVEIATKAATQGVKLTNEKWRSEFEAVDSLIAEGIATEVDEELQHPFHLEFAREKIAAALAAAPAVECPPSNVAALRAALEKIAHYCDNEQGMDDPYCQDGHTCAEIAQAALSVPPRNCDVGTAEEQEKRFTEVCKANSEDGVRGICSETCPFGRDYQSECALAWAQMKYTEGGEA